MATLFEATDVGASGELQEFVASRTGKYRITAAGAGQGESAFQAGAFIEGVFELNEGEKLTILAGQLPANNETRAWSGCGGTFVVSGTPDYYDTHLIITENAAQVASSDAQDVNHLVVKTRIRHESDSNMRIVHTTNDETFACYLTSGTIAFNRYGSNFDGAGTDLDDGEWHDLEWDIHFDQGFADLYIDEVKEGTTTFDAGSVSWSELQLFQRDGSNLYTGDITHVEITADGAPYAKWETSEELEPWADQTGNGRNVSFSTDLPEFYSQWYFTEEPTPLVIAGSAGGFSEDVTGAAVLNVPGQAGKKGGDSSEVVSGGDDGMGGTQGGSCFAESGAGFRGDGDGCDDDDGGSAKAFVNGGSGAIGGSSSEGGFGGGGTGRNNERIGGGGGYSGGASQGGDTGYGGGGGSYNAGENQENYGGDSDKGNYGGGWVKVSTFQPLSGQATDTDGNPVDTVFLHFWDTKELWSSVEPDAEGHWSTEIPEGEYSISYFKAGYQPITHGPYTIEPEP